MAHVQFFICACFNFREISRKLKIANIPNSVKSRTSCSDERYLLIMMYNGVVIGSVRTHISLSRRRRIHVVSSKNKSDWMPRKRCYFPSKKKRKRKIFFLSKHMFVPIVPIEICFFRQGFNIKKMEIE